MTRAGPRPGTVFTPAELARRVVDGLEPAAPVLDPACGEGALLLACLERALAAGVAPGLALGRLFGLELDPELAARARVALADRAAGADRRVPRGQVRLADALTVPWPAGTWIVANPPWGALSGRPSRRFEPGDRARLARRGTAGGWPSLQGPFLLRIAEHVARERTGARVLVPAALLESERYAPLRAELTRRVRLARRPEELGERAFAGRTAPAALLTLAPPEDGHAADGGGAAWSAGGGALVEALARHPRLPPRTFADPGVHTGNAAAELVARGPARAPSRAHRPLREGRDLSAFALGPPGAWVRTDLAPGDGRRFRLRALAHYAGFEVLLRQTADRPIAALHAPAARFRNSLLAARAVEGLDPACLVALLNGPVAAAWHRERFRDARQRAFPQVKVSHLAELPVPLAHRDRDPELHDELARRVRALDPRGDATAFARAVEELGRRTLAAYRLPPALVGAVLEGARPRRRRA